MPFSNLQMSNHKAMERQKFQISHDGLYNLHEITYDLGGYISKTVTYPDLVVVCALPALLNEAKHVLQLKSSSPQLLSYDTTYQLGDLICLCIALQTSSVCWYTCHPCMLPCSWTQVSVSSWGTDEVRCPTLASACQEWWFQDSYCHWWGESHLFCNRHLPARQCEIEVLEPYVPNIGWEDMVPLL